MLGGCVSAPAAPKTPAELIVGAWDCGAPDMTPGSVYRLTLGETGSLLIDFDGGTDQASGARISMVAKGLYETAGDALLVEIESVDIRSAVMNLNGEVGEIEDLGILEWAMAESMNASLDSTFATQGGNGLVIVGVEDPDFSLTCSRLAG